MHLGSALTGDAPRYAGPEAPHYHGRPIVKTWACGICERECPVIDDGRGPVILHDPVKFDAVAPDLLELAADPDREPRIVRAGDEGWVRHGRELYEGDAPGRTRTPRDPR